MKPRTNAVELFGDVALIDISTKAHPDTVTVIDLADLHRVIDGKGRWYAFTAGPHVYAVRSSKKTYLHRHLLDMRPGDRFDVDHVDRNTLNNRRENLRRATRRQNTGNTLARAGTSPHKGVSYDKERRRWKAQIRTNGTNKMLGRFATESEAANAYRVAAQEVFGEFARVS